MKRISDKYNYPRNAYCAIFSESVFPNLPSDAEETLEYLIGTLHKSEANLFMLRYKEEMTYTKIGDSCGLSGERVRQIIAKTLRKLRHPGQSKILLTGREAYLKSVVAENEETKKQYNERIAELEELLRKQSTKIDDLKDKLFYLNHQIKPAYGILSANIDCLGLSTRSWNGLTRAGINTVQDLMHFDDLFKIPNLGRVSIQEIQFKLRVFISTAEKQP